MRFIDGEDLPGRGAMVAEAGNSVALQGRLGSHVLLNSVEAMHGLGGAEGVSDVDGALVRIDRPCGYADEAVRHRGGGGRRVR